MAHKIHVGPKGGKFYISNGKKVYIKEGTKSLARKSPARKSPGRKSPARKSPARGCVKQYSPKYENRPSPAFPANECCGEIKSRYGVQWASEPDKNNVCKWKKL